MNHMKIVKYCDVCPVTAGKCWQGHAGTQTPARRGFTFLATTVLSLVSLVREGNSVHNSDIVRRFSLVLLQIQRVQRNEAAGCETFQDWKQEPS